MNTSPKEDMDIKSEIHKVIDEFFTTGREKYISELESSILSLFEEYIKEKKPLECEAPDVLDTDEKDSMKSMNFGFNNGIHEYKSNLIQGLKEKDD